MVSRLNSYTKGSTRASEFSQTFDYVMVFPLDKNKEQSDVCKDALTSMLQAGLEIYPYRSVQEDELLVLIRASDEILGEFADKIDYKILCDPEVIQEMLEAGDPEKNICPIHITNSTLVSKYTPYEFVYMKYDTEFMFQGKNRQDLYYKPAGQTSIFLKSTRLKLLFLILRSPTRLGGCALKLTKLISEKSILCLYPLHERFKADQMLDHCRACSTWPWNFKNNELKEYFGEKIALYNVFIGHYSKALLYPSGIGLIFQIVVWATLNFSHPVLPFYSLVITVWSIYMLEHWKRLEATTAMEWGMTDFEQQETDRPEFKGITIKSYINGQEMTFFPKTSASRRLALSQSIITTFIMSVIGVVAGIYVLRFSLQEKSNTSPYASLVASILNTIQIQIFNMIYQIVASRLTKNENHRTDTQFEDSMILKLFIFQFINSYASFFFLAFIAGNLEKPDDAPSDFLGQCGATNCMEPLSINLAIIFGTRLTLTNFLDIFIPYINYRNKIKKETSGVENWEEKLTPPEKDYMLMEYDSMQENIKNYADTAIQYGFSLLFITALPCANFFSLLCNYVKVKASAWKLFTFYQRPIPAGAQDIGTWQDIFTIISIVSVITNAGLICFTMDVLWEYSLQGRVWIFIGFQWVLMFIQFTIQAAIPDVPTTVTIQLERIEFITSKIMDKVEDEDYDLERYKQDQANSSAVPIPPDINSVLFCCSKDAKLMANKKKDAVKTGLAPLPYFNYPLDKSEDYWPKEVLTQDTLGAQNEKFNNNSGSQVTPVVSSYNAVQNPLDNKRDASSPYSDASISSAGGPGIELSAIPRPPPQQDNSESDSGNVNPPPAPLEYN